MHCKLLYYPRVFSLLLGLFGILCTAVVVPAEGTSDSSPQWIWGSSGADRSAADGLCLFRRKFQLNSLPQRAILRLTCDDQYVVRLNGRLVGVDEDVANVEQYDVTSVLQKGANQILVRARNLSEGPAGLWLQLDVKDETGQTTQVNTDRRWQASLQKSGTWNPAAYDVQNWQAAHELGTTDASPWKNRLTMLDVVTVGPKRAGNEPFSLRDGDRVLMLGNTVIEREQRYGYWEAALTARYPSIDIIFRNLGWSGDTVAGIARARFGTPAEGFDHLEVHVHAVKPTVILCSYGSNAVFAGADGVSAFVDGYERLLDALEMTGARLVLLAPLPHQPVAGRLLSPQYNRDLTLYQQAIADLAKRRQVQYAQLDLTQAQRATDHPLTDNGLHLTGHGYQATANSLATALGIETAAPPTLKFDWKTQQATSDAATLKHLNATDDTLEFVAARETLPVPLLDSDAPLGMRRSRKASASTNGLRLTVANPPAGNYQLFVDPQSQPAATFTAEQLALGVRLPEHGDQAQRLLQAIRRKNRLYFHRWRPQNETYLFLFRKHEQGNNAVEIPRFDPLVADLEQEIARLRVPRPVRYRLRRVASE